MPRGQCWVHRHIVLIYYLLSYVYAYFITQARNRKAKQEANTMGQGVKGRRTGAGRSCQRDLQSGRHPQPADGGVSQSHMMLCPPVPQRGPISESDTLPEHGVGKARLPSCLGLPWHDHGALPWAELGWTGVLARLLVGNVHGAPANFALGDLAQPYLPSFLIPTCQRGEGGLPAAPPPLGCCGETAETQGLQGPCLFSLQSSPLRG